MSKETKRIKNKYKFNILEVIIISFFNCNFTRHIKLKKNLFEKISNIIYKKLDIVLYIKNQLFFDIMCDIILNSNGRDILNFLSRPVLSAEKFDNNKISSHHNEFEKFYEGISEIIQKYYITQKEKKLILLSQQKIAELI